MTEIANVEELTIAGVHAAYLAGEFSARDLVQAYLGRIERFDTSEGGLNATLAISGTALEEADALDASLRKTGEMVGPLHGVPVVVKDQIETADIATSFGSSVVGEFVPEVDATAIAKLRAAGAIILAKTTMPDFATSWFSTSSRSGVTKNPYDNTRDPGGSSSGTAAAVAANLSLVGIGEDTGGSIRLPASFCNLVGVRVTPGLISRAGMSPLVTPQDTAGPMTRTVLDAATLLESLVGFDSGDLYTVTATIAQHSSYTDGLAEATLSGRRIGVLRSAFGDDADPDGRAVNKVIETALVEMEAAGAELIDVHVNDLDQLVGFTSVYTTRSLSDMNAFFASRPSLGIDSLQKLAADGDYHDKLDLLEAIVAGPNDPNDDPEYAARLLTQNEFQRVVGGLVAELCLDAIVFPDSKLPAPTHEDIFADRWTCLTYPTNTVIASQLLFPAVTVPAGFTSAGLPVGIEIMGLPYAEPDLLKVARGVEVATEGRRAPNLG